MAAIVEAFNLWDVILIDEETDLERDDIFDRFLRRENNNVNRKIATAASFTEKQIIDALQRFSNKLQSLWFTCYVLDLCLNLS